MNQAMTALTEKELTNVSRFLALILRHEPQLINLDLDKQGWGSINDIVANAPSHLGNLSAEVIGQVVALNDKGRYAISPDGQNIRALQGHSIAVDLQLKATEPPAILYHGTVEGFMPSILKHGLLPRSRQNVHLSVDTETAIRVAGRRKGKTVLLSVDCKAMLDDGCEFYLSENKVWLTNEVDPRYLRTLELQSEPSGLGAPSL
jgi:putative RNA 2'-phosphotransferase